MNRFTLFLTKETKIEVKKREGIGDNVSLQLDDTEIRLPEDKLKELWNKLSDIVHQ